MNKLDIINYMIYPLAIRMRPQKLIDVLGQEHLFGENSLLKNSITEKTPISIIFYGPPGTGKSSIAECYANELGFHTIKINAVTSNKKDIDEIIESAKLYSHLVVIIDEIHRLNKDKQDLLLPHLENGLFTVLGTTTANPYISINKAIRSRCHLLEVKPLKSSEIEIGIRKAITSPIGLNNKLILNNNQISYIANISGGDLRFAFNMLEILFLTFKNKKEITDEDIKNELKSNYLMDKNEDDHYDAVSALQKSIRGSDVDAALFYLARLCISEDLASIARRLLVIAYEDVGLGNPQAVDRTRNAIEAAKDLGFPEASIPLGFAVVDLALSPKSRTSVDAIEKTMEFVSKYQLPVKDYLKYTPVEVDDIDKYPYDRPDLWDKIQYLPDQIKDIEFYMKKGSSKYDESLFLNYNKYKQIKRSSNLRELKKIKQ